MPTILARSMMHCVEAEPWFRGGNRWEGYRHRFATDWHTDLMDAMSEHGAAQGLGLEEAAALVGLPGKLGEHGSHVADLVEAGELDRVRAYCETDCLNTFVLYLRWARLTGLTGAAAHDRAVAGLVEYLETQRGRAPHLGRFLDAWRSSRLTWLWLCLTRTRLWGCANPVSPVWTGRGLGTTGSGDGTRGDSDMGPSPRLLAVDGLDSLYSFSFCEGPGVMARRALRSE